MSDQQTCGKGLAERSVLPAKLADLTSAMAEIMAFHQRSLDLTDESGRSELRIYMRLEEQYRAIASLLHATAKTMEAARTLPMAGHDMAVLSSKENADIFARFVSVEEDLVASLQKAIAGDRAMLDGMR